MGISPGTILGQFHVVKHIGSGGMGEVYQARDTKLGRDVAIKVLPDEMAQNHELIVRFQQEAKLLAALDHPNVATLHDFVRFNGTDFLVMQLVDGETLADRIERGPLPLAEAVSIFVQIAEGLEAAHDQGIIHRDLKAANVKITEAGTAKILDFGIAKAFESITARSPDQPTTPMRGTPGRLTFEGTVLGTPVYMSPEQARGKEVDKRTDIWAFGCCLYEALTGVAPFEGETEADTVAFILGREPDWDRLPPAAPPSLKRILQRCLQKDKSRRARDIGDVRLDLEEIVRRRSSDEERGPRARPASRVPLWGIAAACVVIGLVAGLGIPLLRSTDPTEDRDSERKREAVAPKPVAPPPPPLRRYSIILPDTEPVNQPGLIDETLAISPDGARIVYVGYSHAERHLVLREIDEQKTSVMPGTEGASQPFFSPDGLWVGYFSEPDRKLKKVSITGGSPKTLADATILVGAAWGDDDHIVYSPRVGSGLVRVPASGGTPEPLTTLDSDAGEIIHIMPHMSPGSRVVMYTIATGFDGDHLRLAIKNLDTGEERALADKASRGRFLPTGHVVYSVEGGLMAMPFDIDALAALGPAVPVTERRMTTATVFPWQHGISNTGMLVYVPIASDTYPPHSLVWVDRSGVETPLPMPPRDVNVVRIAPDGKRLVLSLSDDDEWDLWIYHLEKETFRRLTFDTAINYNPLWTPDGERIIYSSTRDGNHNLYVKNADGSGVARQLTMTANMNLPYTTTSNGETLAYIELNPDTSGDLWLLSLDGDPETTPLLETTAHERHPALSPDGEWIAFTSNESGRDEVYVQPLPGLDGKWMISSGGGLEPLWSHDGKEIFYRNGESYFGVSVQTDPSFASALPKVIVKRRYYTDVPGISRYFDITPDDQHFLFTKEEALEAGTGARTELLVVENWFQELQRLAPHPKTR